MVQLIKELKAFKVEADELLVIQLGKGAGRTEVEYFLKAIDEAGLRKRVLVVGHDVGLTVVKGHQT